ncbi:MAG: tRNA uridine-5-carboxymethylaminomethyl(34) synthesis GTPase MnmE [Sphingomonadales bacterium]
MSHSDTIYALSSGALPSGVAVVRLSGGQAAACLQALTGGQRLPPPRQLVLRRLRGPGGETIDQALVAWLPGPASFTGEDSAEFHLHGGRAVVAALLAALAAQAGTRPAQPGEFSRRAFDHGRIDLTAAEALADLIAAETEAQRRQAQRQAEGGLARLYDGWRTALIGLMAVLEADLDFADEDLPADMLAPVGAGIGTLAAEITAHLADGHKGERLRDGLKVVVLGPPNAGKSSLINQIARRDVAIVSGEAGTTRDLIEVHLDLVGLPVTLIDTAGLREAAGAVEAEGMRRARQAAADAAMRLLVYDASVGPPPADLAAIADADSVFIANKMDLGAAVPVPLDHWPVSAHSGAGLAALLEAIGARLAALYAPSEAPLLTRARHRHALEETRAALARAEAMLAQDSVLAAEDLRLAARALGRITGRVDVEDLLDRIFSDFCIGK